MVPGLPTSGFMVAAAACFAGVQPTLRAVGTRPARRRQGRGRLPRRPRIAPPIEGDRHLDDDRGDRDQRRPARRPPRCAHHDRGCRRDRRLVHRAPGAHCPTPHHPRRKDTDMDLLEIEDARRLRREDAAAWLHQLADLLRSPQRGRVHARRVALSHHGSPTNSSSRSSWRSRTTAPSWRSNSTGDVATTPAMSEPTRSAWLAHRSAPAMLGRPAWPAEQRVRTRGHGNRHRERRQDVRSGPERSTD